MYVNDDEMDPVPSNLAKIMIFTDISRFVRFAIDFVNMHRANCETAGLWNN